MNSELNIEECFEFVQKLTKQCGEILLEGVKNCGEVEIKGFFHDLVTIYDGKIEKILMDGIKEKYPTHKFIAEEETSANKELQEFTDQPTWFIDPIDGTNNFVHGLHLSVISIALTINKELQLAIIFNPCLDEFFTARKGHGAFLNGERITVNKVTDMQKALFAHEISLASIPRTFEKNIERIKAFVMKVVGIRALGSAALTLAYVARGVIDAYNVEDLKPWDNAAGILLIEEAGGVVINKNGGDYDIMKPDIVAACTPELCQQILDIITEIDRKLSSK